MADSIKVTEGSGPKVATDELEIDGATAHVQRVKPVIGAAGSGVDVSSANPMPVNDAGGSLTVDGTVSVGEPTVKVAASQTVGIAAGTAEIGKVKVTELPATPTGTNSIGKVKSIEEALPTGANAIGKLAANSGVDIGDVDVTSLTGGTIAHDAADSGNPLKTGSKAVTTLPTAVSTLDRTDNLSDKYGRQLYAPNPPDRLVSGKALLENETSTEVVAAGGAGVRILVTQILITNASTTTSSRVEILDEATGKIIGEAVKSGGGWNLVNPHGIFIGTANKPVKAKCLTTGAKVDVFIGGYQIPE